MSFDEKAKKVTTIYSNFLKNQANTEFPLFIFVKILIMKAGETKEFSFLYNKELVKWSYSDNGKNTGVYCQHPIFIKRYGGCNAISSKGNPLALISDENATKFFNDEHWDFFNLLTDSFRPSAQ